MPLCSLLLAMSISPQDHYALSEAVYFEARNQSVLGQTGVACTIRNRVEKRNWPNTYREVIWQPKQFSYTHDGKPEVITDRQAWFVASTVASQVLQTNVCDVFDGVDHYINPARSTKTWYKAMYRVMIVGDHHFFRRDE